MRALGIFARGRLKKKYSYNTVFPLGRLAFRLNRRCTRNNTVSILCDLLWKTFSARSGIGIIPKLRVLEILPENGERLQAYEKMDSYKYRKVEATLTNFIGLTTISPFYLASNRFRSYDNTIERVKDCQRLRKLISQIRIFQRCLWRCSTLRKAIE